MSDLVEHFDREAAEYPTHLGADYIQTRKWALVAAHAPVGGIAADIGAATGRHAVELATPALDVVAIDPSAQMLGQLVQHARSRRTEATILPCAAALPDLPFANASFDLVYCFSTLLLLSPGAQADAVATMARSLRPGGTLIVDVAGARSLAVRYWRRHYRRRGLEGVFGHRIADARRMVADNGLEIISTEAHGVLSQLLLFPGLQKLPGLVRMVRGSETRPGWDAWASERLTGLAERWYIVATKPDRADG